MSHTRGNKPFTGAGYTDINAEEADGDYVDCAAAVFSAVPLQTLVLLLSSLIVGAGWRVIVSNPASNQRAKSEYVGRSTATRQACCWSDVVTYHSGDSPATAQQVAADLRYPLDPTIVSPAFSSSRAELCTGPMTATLTRNGNLRRRGNLGPVDRQPTGLRINHIINTERVHRLTGQHRAPGIANDPAKWRLPRFLVNSSGPMAANGV